MLQSGIHQPSDKSSLGFLKLTMASYELTISQYGIFDLFATTTPYGRLTGGSVLNGPVWTLHYERGCYLVIGLLVIYGIL